MRGTRLPGALLCAVLGVLAFAGAAQACSCAPQAVGESLRQADAAIVGRLVAVTPRGPLRAEYRYEVHRVYRGKAEIDPGQTLTVRSPSKDAACALPRRTGRRYGLFLTRDRGHLFGGLCGVIAPRQLSAAAEHGTGAERAGAGGGAGCAS